MVDDAFEPEGFTLPPGACNSRATCEQINWHDLALRCMRRNNRIRRKMQRQENRMQMMMH